MIFRKIFTQSQTPAYKTKTKQKTSSRIKKAQITIENHKYNVVIKKYIKSKKISLNISPKNNVLQVSIPYHLSYEKALDFVNNNHDWIKSHPYYQNKIDFNSCTNISILENVYEIQDVSANKGKYNINHELKIITIYAKNSELRQKHLINCLKDCALEIFSSLSSQKCKVINTTYAKISIMDQKKWGSCSNNKHLKYNFRVIMAPIFVIDYLCAHEVAHLQEFNHSMKFWQLTNTLCQNNDYTLGKNWLKNYGNTLY